ncbi:MAG TPA: hypothetical protein DCM05_13410 [Elusimicrobia bacterium]|nr:hypothetical protein [Elusimicrobiota bacterium]
MAARRKSPQEKKAISYERDRRNHYGQNAKGSRKRIPARKRWVNRVFRHTASQRLSGAHGAVDGCVADELDVAVGGLRRKNWRKSPDIPLKDHIAEQLRRRKVRVCRRTAECRARRAWRR